MSQPSGVYLPLSRPRRLIGDLLHFAREVPTVPVERRMRLSAVARARAATALRPSWCALFLKAYAIVSAATPLLRRAYLTFPWPRLYEHPINMMTVAVERRFRDEDAVLFAHVRQPETLSLADIETRLRRFKDGPLETISSFRRCLRVSGWPRPLRRLLCWGALNISGRKRAHFFGTCVVTAYSSLGASSLHPLTPLTTTLNYGVVEPDGTVDVRLTYDHRVMDGAPIARALADLESVLHHEILAELRYLEDIAAA